ncbi:hypothetical protein [Myceligenerans pegani]|uniref:Uncharacterized protein n=1 Tax=Myceligenerans pegani TaxID=2776917 RepID=A0ABR9N1Y3_9MICO|nr:hypothetical protein [Myceligenerans sp. TRM 65318]MBE1877653.1 hypothetical protein [Myceligenerans sp. TRM 65318]MBE3019924.1 hypothetical protein [Myceligenerans sp. TRM 65318]
MRVRHLRLAGVLLAGAALALGPAGAGHAADAEDGETDTGISVTIPSTAPTDDPTGDPTGGPTGDPTRGPGAGPDPSDGPGGGNGAGGGTGTGGAPGGGDPGGPGSPGDTPGGGSGDPTGGPDAPGDGGTTDPEECEPAEPAVPQEPATDGDDATLDDDVHLAGDEVVATGNGFGDRERVQAVLFTEPQVVRTVRADAKGVVDAALEIPDETPPGPRALQLTGWCGQIALAEVLVGSPGGEATGLSIPAWAWWTGGGVGLAGLGAGGWYVLRLMRAPGAGLPVGDAGVAA